MEFSQIIICDDDRQLLEMYKQYLTDYGFTSIQCLDNSEHLIEHIKTHYTQPTVLICDYCVSPFSPSRYLPELKQLGMEIPAIIVSGRIQPVQMNELILNYPLRGFFEKGNKARQAVATIAKQLVDIGSEAVAAFDAYQLQNEIRQFIKNLDANECAAMLRLMAMEEVKTIAGDLGFGVHSVYALRKEMERFVSGTKLPARFSALHRELTRRREILV